MKTLKILSFLFVLVVLQSCSEKIDLELNDTYPRLVVEGAITDQPGPHFIKVTSTSSYFTDEAPTAISDAEVSISDENSTWILQQVEDGVYATDSNFFGVAGHTYQLKITRGEEEYTASSTLRTVPPLDSVSIAPYPIMPVIQQIFVHFQETINSADFYLWKVFLNGDDITNTPSQTPFSDDQGLDGIYISASIYNIRPDLYTLSQGDTINVRMYSIDYEYMMFLVALMRNQGSTGGPFAGPPANIKGNISNGALGYFIASAVTESTMIYQ